MVPTSDTGSQHLNTGEHASYGVEEARGCVVVTAEGQIDLETSPGLRDAVQVAEEFSHHVVIDLTQVSFLDATGLGVLAEARTHARDRDGAVALVGPSGIVSTALQASKLDGAFAIHDHLDEAVAGMSDL